MKVAIVGTEKTSQGLAPWDDPSWEIWTCSHSSVDYPRVSAFFELHRPERLLETYGVEKYLPYFMRLEEFAQQGTPVWVSKYTDYIPTATVLNPANLVGEFGYDFFTSSVAWMMGKALQDGASELGLWGIDMTAKDEYLYQRPGCKFFIREALKRGVNVTIPPESDLAHHTPLYGFREHNPLWIKGYKTRKALTSRLEQTTRDKTAKAMEENFLLGALERVEYDLMIKGG